MLLPPSVPLLLPTPPLDCLPYLPVQRGSSEESRVRGGDCLCPRGPERKESEKAKHTKVDISRAKHIQARAHKVRGREEAREEDGNTGKDRRD